MTVRKLGDVAAVLFGFPFSSRSFSENGEGIRLLRGDNIAQGTLRWAGAKYWPKTKVFDEKYLLCEGDLVLAMDRPIVGSGLKYAVVRANDEPSLLVQRVARIRALSGVDQRYLGYLVASQAFIDYVQAITTGSAVPHISGPDILEFQHDYPSLDIQYAIGEVLGALDDKIAANRRTAAALNELTSAMFQALKSNPQSEMPLGDLVEITKGVSYRSADLAPSSTALVSLKSVDRSGNYQERGLKEYVGPFKPKQIVHPGEIVVAQTDLTQGAEVVGRAVRVPLSSAYECLVASLDLAIVRPTERINPLFLLGALREDRFRAHCRSHVSGTTVLHLGSKAIPTYGLRFPAKNVQDAFARMVGPMYALADALGVENQRLARTQTELLQPLMSGQLQVQDARHRVEQEV